MKSLCIPLFVGAVNSLPQFRLWRRFQILGLYQGWLGFIRVSARRASRIVGEIGMDVYRLAVCFAILRCVLGAEAQVSAIQQPASAPSQSALQECPLNVTQLVNHEWIIQRCKQNDQYCCQSLTYLVMILFFSWLHRTGLFLLPDVHTAYVCLDAIRQELDVLGMEPTTFGGCNLRAENFVSGTGAHLCGGIRVLSDFERAVNTSAMQRYCKFAPRPNNSFQCGACLNAMAAAFNWLARSRGDDQFCQMFVISFVGGGMNSYTDVGPDSATCLLASQDLLKTSNSSNSTHHSGRNHAVRVAIAVTIPSVVLLIGVCICAIKTRYRGAAKEPNRWKCLAREVQLPSEGATGRVELTTGAILFSFEEIKESTRNFSALNVAGEGGSAIVYRGVLPDGSEIAVKRFKDCSIKGDEVFRNEVNIISNIRHRNLLALKGYCIWSGEPGIVRSLNLSRNQHFLVYDFMPNGSLADYLFSGKKPCLSWPQRLKIAVGVARGLAYLHDDVKPPIIHRDVKAANVLLDADLDPLVADFGLARLKVEDYGKSHYTTRAVGTMGYVAPEYALYGHLTVKSDVFSFGILLLELISGRRALDSSFAHPEGIHISHWAYELTHSDRLEEVIDKRIAQDSVSVKMMEKGVLLALQCIHPKVAQRPFIHQTLVALECIDRPLVDMFALSNIQLQTDSHAWDRLESNWRLYGDMEGRTSHGLATHGNVSLDSYRDGR